MNKQGAIAGMVVGLSVMLFYMLKFKFGLFDGGKTAVAGLQENWWWGISPEGFGSVAMLINFAVALLVNYFTPPPPEDVQMMVEDIRIPQGASAAQAH